jgi:hypothetical protein
MSENHKANLGVVIQFFQLATLIVGVAGLFLTVGRKDARLDQNTVEIAELKDIASELAKTSIESTMANREQDRRLDDLRDRLARMEFQPMIDQLRENRRASVLIVGAAGFLLLGRDPAGVPGRRPR